MKESKVRELIFKILAPVYFCLIFCVPLSFCIFLFVVMPSGILQYVVVLLSPAIYIFLYILTAGLLSLPHRKSIIAGRFPRSLGNKIYFHRRLYGLCWTSVYYFTPIFFIALSIPPLKTLLFRLFGYRGRMNFTTYPDTWIRDIALLQLGNNAYLSNRATMGTNIAFPDGTILVDVIKIGDGALVGHLSMIAPGVELGKNVEVGVGVAIGLKSTLGDGVRINPCCAIEHGVKIGARTKVGSMVYIGSGVSIASDLVIPAGITIPPKTKITCQEDVSFFAEHINQAKTHHRNRTKQFNLIKPFSNLDESIISDQELDNHFYPVECDQVVTLNKK